MWHAYPSFLGAGSSSVVGSLFSKSFEVRMTARVLVYAIHWDLEKSERLQLEPSFNRLCYALA